MWLQKPVHANLRNKRKRFREIREKERERGKRFVAAVVLILCNLRDRIAGFAPAGNVQCGVVARIYTSNLFFFSFFLLVTTC